MTSTFQVPSRKWIATQVTALAALLTAWVNNGAWDKMLTIALIGLVSQALIGYLVPNASASTSAAPTPVPAVR